MVKTVYVDLLFLINFSMDFLCFYLSAKIMSVRLSTLRAILAAILGGIYSGIVLFFSAGYFFSLALDLAVCFLLCAIAFGRKNGLFFSSVVFFSVSMALGGFMTALFNLFNRLGFSSLERTEDMDDGISVWLFALLALVSGVITLLGGRFFKRNAKVRKVELRITEGKRRKVFNALVDSGNLLRDPISGVACIVVDVRAARGVFDKTLLDVAAREGICAMESLAPDVAKRVRVIPSFSAAGEKMLLGLRAEGLSVICEGKEYESDALLVFTRLDGAQGAEALVPPELLN